MARNGRFSEADIRELAEVTDLSVFATAAGLFFEHAAARRVVAQSGGVGALVEVGQAMDLDRAIEAVAESLAARGIGAYQAERIARHLLQ